MKVHDYEQLELRYNYSSDNYGLATLLPLVEVAFMAFVVDMKLSSSSSIFDVAGPLPLQAPPFGFDEATSLLFDDSAFLALVLGMKISFAKILASQNSKGKYESRKILDFVKKMRKNDFYLKCLSFFCCLF
jgi:hypothetical protein